MRLALVNWTNRKIGGTGSYLSTIAPRLREAGFEVALWHEVDVPADLDVIPLPAASPVWSVASLGLEPALAALKEWQPSVIYAHGLLDPAVERRTLGIAPSVFFAHNYYGTCISGAKTFKSPVVTPCSRRFGWQCLANYYPRRCGGWSPVTMVRHFHQQKSRLELLSEYTAIVTHSEHMQREYLNHGLSASRVFDVRHDTGVRETPAETEPPNRRAPKDRLSRLVFVGRMDRLKGGRELLMAMPDVARQLGGIHLTFAGDGPDRSSWEALARQVQADNLEVEFLGWIDRAALDALFARSDLLVLPSLWPEPLALVGLESAQHRLPVAAFDVGGISDWLISGVNGFLAPGDPPTIAGLVEAIVSCLRDRQTHERLRDGAGRLSASGAFDSHVELLLRVLSQVARTA